MANREVRQRSDPSPPPRFGDRPYWRQEANVADPVLECLPAAVAGVEGILKALGQHKDEVGRVGERRETRQQMRITPRPVQQKSRREGSHLLIISARRILHVNRGNLL